MEHLCAESRTIAEDLYAVLHAFDRSSRPDAASHAVRLEQLSGRVQALLRLAAAPGDPRAQALVESLRDVHSAVAELRRPAAGVDWAACKRRAAAAYERLAAGLHGFKVRVPSLRPRNYARNAFHVACGLVALTLAELLPGRSFMLAVAGTFLVFAWTMEIGRRRSEAWRRFAVALFKPVIHPHEHVRVNSATWFVTALFCLALWAPVASCAMGVTVLALADPAAAIIGRRFGRVKIRAARSLEGTSAFVVVAFLASLGALAVFHPALGAGRMAALAVVAALSGALAELYSGRVDDNFTIPVAVAAATAPLLLLLG